MSQKFTVSPLFDDLSTILGILKVYMTAVYSKRMGLYTIVPWAVIRLRGGV